MRDIETLLDEDSKKLLARKVRRDTIIVSMLIVVLLVALKVTEAAVRTTDDPPVQNSLPAVCLSGATVCTPDDPMRGDFNGNGELDAGDLVIMQRAVFGELI